MREDVHASCRGVRIGGRIGVFAVADQAVARFSVTAASALDRSHALARPPGDNLLEAVGIWLLLHSFLLSLARYTRV